jgi:hypothetical protein
VREGRLNQLRGDIPFFDAVCRITIMSLVVTSTVVK